MKEKMYNVSMYTIGILSIVILAFLGIKYILPVLSPFLIAWVIVALTRKSAEKLSKKAKIPVSIIRLMMSIFVAIIALSSVALLVWQASSVAWHFLTNIEDSGRLMSFIDRLFSPRVPVIGDAFPEELADRISDAIGEITTSALRRLADGVATVAGAIPQLLLFLLITLISLIYFSLDYDRIIAVAKSILPKKLSAKLSGIRENAIGMLGKYLRSYSLLILMTYFMLLVGFLILRVDRAVFLALVVAVLDRLPIIGVGTVLVPWGAFEIATGSTFLGVGLILLFVINAVLRQFLEPKIIGKSLNIHPIITLIMIYAGYSLFGILGLIILPVVAIVVATLLKSEESTEIA